MIWNLLIIILVVCGSNLIQAQTTIEETTLDELEITSKRKRKIKKHKISGKPAFNGISQEEIEKTKAMPFFDAEIFLEITGIDLTDKPVEAKKMTVAEVSQMLGYDIEIVKG